MEPLDAAAVAALGDMAHQVGGHAGPKAGLKAHDGKVFKPFQSGRRGEREHEFYARVFGPDASPALVSLIPFVPRYYGVVEAPPSDDGAPSDKFLVLEDLTFGRAWPCIMDVKVGTRSFERDATPEKVAYEQSKFPLQQAAGFRLQGIKAFDAAAQAYVELDKHFGRRPATIDDLPPAFARFFPADDRDKTRFLLQAFLTRLEALAAWFETQQDAEFVASSLLFVYSGEPNRGVPPGDLQQAFAPDIRLIDFAHVTHPDPPSRDEGVCTGLQTLIECFRRLLERSANGSDLQG